jgi:hypothetical protein
MPSYVVCRNATPAAFAFSATFLYVITQKSGEITRIVNNTLAQVWNGTMPTRVALESIHDQVTALLKD